MEACNTTLSCRRYPRRTADATGSFSHCTERGSKGWARRSAYARKPGLYVVAPTNRRPYGFDWEDWGRLDAIEVLELAQKAFETDPQRTYLTGHSMGGHGTWHLGVTSPDRFAAIAPSAGWISMWSYAGAKRPRMPSPIEELMAPGRLAQRYFGAVTEPRPAWAFIFFTAMPTITCRLDRPGGCGRRSVSFIPISPITSSPERATGGANACVDWPPLFAFLADHTIPSSIEVRKIDFVTASPGVSARALADDRGSAQALLPSTVHLDLDPEHRRFRGTTENVARLVLDLGRALPNMKESGPVLGRARRADVAAGFRGCLHIRTAIDRSGWFETAALVGEQFPPLLPEKRPARQGPFKEAFRNRFVLVYGTKGHPRRMLGRWPGRGSMRRRSGTGATARPISSSDSTLP